MEKPFSECNSIRGTDLRNSGYLVAGRELHEPRTPSRFWVLLWIRGFVEVLVQIEQLAGELNHPATISVFNLALISAN